MALYMVRTSEDAILSIEANSMIVADGGRLEFRRKTSHKHPLAAAFGPGTWKEIAGDDGTFCTELKPPILPTLTQVRCPQCRHVFLFDPPDELDHTPQQPTEQPTGHEPDYAI